MTEKLTKLLLFPWSKTRRYFRIQSIFFAKKKEKKKKKIQSIFTSETCSCVSSWLTTVSSATLHQFRYPEVCQLFGPP
jgi:hypothetical protein